MKKEIKCKTLILEDDINRINEFKQRFNEVSITIEPFFVDTAKDCIDKLEADHFDLVFLDHDLGGQVFVDTENKNTGSEVARYISTSEKSFDNTTFICHSYNPAGRKNICSLIKGCHEIPSIWDESVFHERLKFN